MDVGLDRIRKERELATLVRGRRVALLAHPASIDVRLDHAGTILRELGARMVRYFGPEHGFGGEAQDMIGVTDAKARDGLPIVSLYGEHEADLVPKEGDLSDIDVLVVDLQDVGARYYTFIWTAVLALRVAAKLGKGMIILDRPNPIGTSLDAVEGKLFASDHYRSFVGLEPLPVRHGLTLGEIVAHRAHREGISKEALRVVAVRNVPASAFEWDRPFVPPSPNMPTADTALVYPGGCLLEGTNLSEGRGTTRPFEMFGAPWLDGEELARRYAELGLPGARARPISFYPMFQKHARTHCGGVFVHVEDRATFRPMATYVALIALAHAIAPRDFAFRTERYEFRDDVPALDLLIGAPSMREAMIGGASVKEILAVSTTATPLEIELVRAAKSEAAPFMIA